MPKIDLQALSKLTGGASAAPVGELDFLSRINATIKNFKGLMELAREAQGLTPVAQPPGPAPEIYRPLPPAPLPPAPPPPAPPPPPPPPPAKSALAAILNKLCETPYANATVEQLYKGIKGLTLKQLREVFINVSRPGL